MNQNEMIQRIHDEIAKLQRVVDLLLDQSTDTQPTRSSGRSKGSGNRATSFNPDEFAPQKRTMSAEGKARIAAAQKKRWAMQRVVSPARIARKQAASVKQTSKTVTPKQVSKVAPLSTKKSATTRKTTGESQKRTGKVDARKTSTKAAAKKMSRPATKRLAKQVTPIAPEAQATA